MLSAPESTEVMYAVNNIIGKTVKALSEVKTCVIGCWDSAGPSMIVTTEPVWKAINELAKRGISLQYITDINRENISFCKIMIENGTQLRHLPGIKSNFGITDRTEYMATVIMEEEKPLWHAIVSNAKTFVVVFDALWSKALPAEQRIREIEEGFKMFTETIFDASEIEKITFDSVKSAKEEITILFSTADAFKRQERLGLMRLLHETDPIVKVRIMLPGSFALRDIIKDRLDEDRRIEIRYFLNSSLQTILTSLTVDRKLCLIAEMENNTKDNSRKTVELATYSNSDSIVWTHASIFETLWTQSKSFPENQLEQ